MPSRRARLARLSARFLHQAQALTEARVLNVHGSDFRQHSTLAIIKVLYDRAQNMHLIANAGDLADQPLQRLPDIRQIDDRLASLIAHDGISLLIPLYGHRVGPANYG